MVAVVLALGFESALAVARARHGLGVVLGVESALNPVESRLAELTGLARSHGGSPSPADGDRDSAADTWRTAFLRMPYVRDGLARMSAIVETFETACTRDRAPELYETVRTEVGAAVEKVTGRRG